MTVRLSKNKAQVWICKEPPPPPAVRPPGPGPAAQPPQRGGGLQLVGVQLGVEAQLQDGRGPRRRGRGEHAAPLRRCDIKLLHSLYLVLRTDLTHVGEVEAAVEAGHALGPAGGSAGPAVRRVPGVHPVPRLPVPVAAVLVAAHQPPAAGLAHRRGLGAGAGQRGAEEAAAVEGGGVGRGAGRVGHAAVTEGGARGEHGGGAGAEGAAVRLQVTQLPAARVIIHHCLQFSVRDVTWSCPT